MSKKNYLPKSLSMPDNKDNRDDSSILPGWPGYRTRDGRSGYDPIDTRTEAAHTTGTFIQKLFSGQLRIRNPIYLILSGILGLILIVPLFLAILETTNGNSPTWDGWFAMLIVAIIGLALLNNFVKNLNKA
jgi:hypothetical protein